MGARSPSRLRQIALKTEKSKAEFLQPREVMVCGCDAKRPRHSLMCMAKLSGEKI